MQTTQESVVATTKYAEVLCDWLVELGYTDCFFVAGGNIMHLLDGARKRFRCVPFVHEVAAGIAAEYFNEAGTAGRAFALVTAGPGLTNVVTAISGAWLESRELLVIGGQAKSSDLASNGIRQRGIQEIDGVSIVSSITVGAERIETPWTKRHFVEAVLKGRRERPGPVFIEICLDAQGAPVVATDFEDPDIDLHVGPSAESVATARNAIEQVVQAVRDAARPVILLGGGVTRETAEAVRTDLARIGIPVMTTWNGIDRLGAEEPIYAGRPNTWGQRAANILLFQADCIIALGTRLGLQQTGFNWQEFGKHAFVVQVEIDPAELKKGHPKVDLPIAGDANEFLRALCTYTFPDYSNWLLFCHHVRDQIPLNEPWNETSSGYISPYAFYEWLNDFSTSDDVIIPCSSGGANSTAMQTIAQKRGQIVIVDKGLASMGYGLGGAIGAALALGKRRTILVEGDGGFAQNLQELATVAVNDLNVKIFIFSNEGYGSIRTTQRNYFGGAYLGCDTRTGLGFPDWTKLFDAFDIPCMWLDEDGLESEAVRSAMSEPGRFAFIVPIDPQQTYYPKITSRVTETGSMESNPLHLMSPELPAEIAQDVFRYRSIVQSPA